MQHKNHISVLLTGEAHARSIHAMKKAQSGPVDDAERRRDILRRVMAEKGLNVKRWAELAGLSSPSTLYNFLNGYSKSLSPETYQKLAEAAHVPVEALTGELGTIRPTTAIKVIGFVQAGVWREAVELPDDQWALVAMNIPPRYVAKCFGLEVRGASMNLVYPPGATLICVNFYEFDRDLKDGDRVIVKRTRKDGQIEATVKELRAQDDTVYLWPRSTDPRFQRPIELGNSDTETVEIYAVVVAYQALEPNID